MSSYYSKLLNSHNWLTLIVCRKNYLCIKKLYEQLRKKCFLICFFLYRQP
jgi:hypothetical protein